MTALTESEGRKLNDLETIISEGLKTFVEVGAALSIIREQRLYRSTHETFDAYCEERWGWDRTRAHRLIQASDIVQTLPIGNRPENEGQARELIRVPPEQRATVLTEARAEAATEGKRVTAERIRETAHKYTPVSQRKPKPAAAPNADAPPTAENVRRFHRRPVDSRITSFVATAIEMADVTDDDLKNIQATRVMVEGLKNAVKQITRIIDLYEEKERVA